MTNNGSYIDKYNDIIMVEGVQQLSNKEILKYRKELLNLIKNINKQIFGNKVFNGACIGLGISALVFSGITNNFNGLYGMAIGSLITSYLYGNAKLKERNIKKDSINRDLDIIEDEIDYRRDERIR